MSIKASSVQDMYDKMSVKLANLVPPIELRLKAELAYEINRLKQEKDAIILGHNYMEPALFYSVADVVGDSLALCRKAASTNNSTIVFCGVKFMAETAKILNPSKTVLLPSEKAGCSLAASITADDVRWLKSLYPGVPVVSYVNTYADVKAESDYCCTSGNAAELVRSLGTKQVIFLPDEYLAKNVAKTLGMSVKVMTRESDPNDLKLDAGMIAWGGRCEVHEKFSVDDITNVRRQFPEVAVLAHPECSPEVVQASDYAGSTQEMIRYVEQTKAKNYLLLTECAMGDNIAAANPERDMLRLCSVRCPHMNEITLEQTLKALQFNRYEIDVPEPIRTQARTALLRMIEIG